MSTSQPGGSPKKPKGPDPLIGTQIGHYRLLQMIGTGGMGTVYRAQHVVLEKQVAMKLLAEPFIGKNEMLARFIQEAKAVAKIGHRNIVDVTDFGQSSRGQPYFIMELLDGQSLGAVIARDQIIRVRDILSIFTQICDALAAAHEKGIIHRDIKPENIFILGSGKEDLQVKLLDFGVAKVLDEHENEGEGITRMGTIVGTPHYMSPEQAGGEAVDHRSDVYTLGVILYEIFTGHRPFKGKSLRELKRKQLFEPPKAPRLVNPEIPAELDTFILKVLEKDPAKRPQGIREFYVTLQTVLVELLKVNPDMAVRVPDRDPALTPSSCSPGARFTPTPSTEESPTQLGTPLPFLEEDLPPELPVGDSVEITTSNLAADRPVPPRRKVWLLVAVGAVVLGSAGAVLLLVGSGSKPEAAVRVEPGPEVAKANGPARPIEPAPPAPDAGPAGTSEKPSPDVPAPAPFAIEVLSVPAGAGIYLQNKLLGRTPSTLSLDQATRLEVRAKGYKTATVEASPGIKSPVRIKLIRADASGKTPRVKPPPKDADPSLD